MSNIAAIFDDLICRALKQKQRIDLYLKKKRLITFDDLYLNFV